MPTCAAVGAFAKVLVEPKSAEGDADPTFDNASERYSFLYETLSSDRGITGTRAITGSRSIYSDRIVLQPYTPSGFIGFQPGPNDFDAWLQRTLGGTKSGNDITVAETLPIFDMLVYRENGCFRYKNCRVSQAAIRGKSGPTEDESEIISMSIGIIAMDETEESYPVSEPAVPTGGSVAPYTFSMGVLTIGGTAYGFNEFTLTINNMLQAQHRNSLAPTCVYSAGRQIRLEVDNPFTTNHWTMAKTLYTTGSTGSLKFTAGTKSCDFTFPLLRSPRETPSAKSKGEIPLSIKMMALRTNADEEITVVNDIT